MDVSIFIARMIGVIYVSVGLGMLIFNRQYLSSFLKLEDNPGYALLGGFMAVIGGMAMVTYHNLWVNDWRVLVTIIGWIALIKGILLLIMPNYIHVFVRMIDNKNIRSLSVLILLFGLIFTYLGFFK